MHALNMLVESSFYVFVFQSSMAEICAKYVYVVQSYEPHISLYALAFIIYAPFLAVKDISSCYLYSLYTPGPGQH